jgi:hypothetical protein
MLSFSGYVAQLTPFAINTTALHTLGPQQTLKTSPNIQLDDVGKGPVQTHTIICSPTYSLPNGAITIDIIYIDAASTAAPY